MITSVFFLILYGAIVAIISPLFLTPDVSLSANVLTAITNAGSSLAVIYAVIPLTVLSIVGIFVAFLAVEGALFIYKGIRWGYQKLPGVN